MNLKNKLKSKKVIIGIIGLGYVGLPLANAFVNKNIKVYGFDNDKTKIKKINQGKSYINYFSDTQIQKMKKNNFKCFTNLEKIPEVDLIILCLPTPVYKNKSPDISYIKNTLEELKTYFRKYQTLSLESTTYPGTSREVILPYLKKFNVGKDFFLVYSPEREDPGNKKYSILKIPKVIGGYSRKCLELGSKFYSLLGIKLIKVSSLESAELTKLLENIYRSVNIGMVNEMKLLCNKMKINIFEVINAAKTKPFGFQAFYPGPGYGGHCIPIDPFLLSWRAKQFKMKTKFIELSGKVNEAMPSLIVSKIIALHKKEIKKIPKILIIGAAYKKNVDDIRESPALKIMNILNKKKIKYDYLDPYVKEINNTRQINKKIKSISIRYNLLSNYTLTAIITDHDNLNYLKILKYSNLILDTRGRYTFIKSKKVIQA
tara:strand:- start:7081 stop:8370 length:1290 start_codon:yes stop_codon:yes gene_type:complete